MQNSEGCVCCILPARRPPLVGIWADAGASAIPAGPDDPPPHPRVADPSRCLGCCLSHSPCSFSLGGGLVVGRLPPVVRLTPGKRRGGRDTVAAHRIVCATPLGAAHPLLAGIPFAFVVVDDAAGATEPETLIPLLKGAVQVCCPPPPAPSRPLPGGSRLAAWLCVPQRVTVDQSRMGGPAGRRRNRQAVICSTGSQQATTGLTSQQQVVSRMVRCCVPAPPSLPASGLCGAVSLQPRGRCCCWGTRAAARWSTPPPAKRKASGRACSTACWPPAWTTSFCPPSTACTPPRARPVGSGVSRLTCASRMPWGGERVAAWYGGRPPVLRHAARPSVGPCARPLVLPQHAVL